MALETVSTFENGKVLKDGNGDKFVMLSGAVMNFPHLLKKKKFKSDKGDGNYSVRILIPKSWKAAKDVILAIGKELAAEKKLDWSKLKDDHKFLIDGDKTEYTEEDGHYVIKTKESRRPVVRRKNKEVLSPDDEGAQDLIYSGGYADVIFGFYAYNGEYKGVKANPKSVRLLERGEQFANSGGIDDEDVYDDDDGEGFERDDDDNDL